MILFSAVCPYGNDEGYDAGRHYQNGAVKSYNQLECHYFPFSNK